ncbi:hypothetical protein LX36DRAFT_463971 [Colletotrichum falcatum]|nr:hypothetical protein LX36DRAFT_463971 [Colletotrichum falcatum]
MTQMLHPQGDNGRPKSDPRAKTRNKSLRTGSKGFREFGAASPRKGDALLGHSSDNQVNGSNVKERVLRGVT